MALAIVLSIRPEQVNLIANNLKNIDLRKTRPSKYELPTPFLVYIYCTKPKQRLKYVYRKSDYKGYMPDDVFQAVPDDYKAFVKIPDAASPFHCSPYSGRIVGKFICNRIYNLDADSVGLFTVGLFSDDQREYISKKGLEAGVSLRDIRRYAGGSRLYGWEISDLVLYESPLTLDEVGLKRPPQSWGYVNF